MFHCQVSYSQTLPFLLTTETITNYQVVSPVVRFKSDDLSAKVDTRPGYCMMHSVLYDV